MTNVALYVMRTVSFLEKLQVFKKMVAYQSLVDT